MPKTRVNLSIDVTLLEISRLDNLNLSALLESVLKETLMDGKKVPSIDKLNKELVETTSKATVLKAKIRRAEEVTKEQNEEIKKKLRECVVCNGELGDKKKQIGKNMVCHSCFMEMDVEQLNALRE